MTVTVYWAYVPISYRLVEPVAQIHNCLLCGTVKRKNSRALAITRGRNERTSTYTTEPGLPSRCRSPLPAAIVRLAPILCSALRQAAAFEPKTDRCARTVRCRSVLSGCAEWSTPAADQAGALGAPHSPGRCVGESTGPSRIYAIPHGVTPMNGAK